MARDLSIDGPQTTVSSSSFAKLNTLPLILFFIGIFVLAVGAGLFLFKNQDQDDIQIIESDISSPVGQIVVHVDGSVKAPGVYSLPFDSRVANAVEAAGGLTEKADQSKINLAAKLADGQKIRIPEIGEIKGAAGAGTNAGSSTDQSALVSVNDASQAQLEALPGIGPVTAQKIIASRPYSTLEELKTKKVVGSSVYEKIKDLVTI